MRPEEAHDAQAMGASHNAGFLPAAEYDLIQARIPILCVDLVPVSTESPARIGLIRRATYAGGTGWCLVGGRVLHNESLLEAVLRHARATLGPSVRVDVASLALHKVIEYFPSPERGEFHDPRKHAVALTYAGACSGEPRACGEAIEFAWFKRDQLAGLAFGFGQDRVVRAVLAELGDR
jgi:ADP-ribose pyrophosphatase YjhB (NUDIX family)